MLHERLHTLRSKFTLIKDAGGSITGEQSSMFDEYTNGSKIKCSETNELITLYIIYFVAMITDKLQGC